MEKSHMKKILIQSMVICTLTAFYGCSSEDTNGKPENMPKHAGQTPKWDYDQVRKAREAEKTEDACMSNTPDESECDIVTKKQMLKAGKSGCTPVDPKKGLGENKFCCPKP